MAEQAKIMTLRDHDTGLPVAPRTVVDAISGEGKKWNYVGFTEDNVVGVVDGTWPCNQNLLHNWYFVGDGSLFPINQRGAAEYSNSRPDGYFIDGWRVANPIGNQYKMNISESGLQVTATNNVWFQHFFERDINWSDGYTFSILTTEGLGTVYIDNPSVVYWSISGTDNFVPTLEIRDKSIGIIFAGTGTIIAVKLELGSTQTLAHKEGGTWVLNEVPDYATELVRCQRYYNTSYQNAAPGTPGSYTNELVLHAISTNWFGNTEIRLPCTMRTTPVVTFYNPNTGGKDMADGIEKDVRVEVIASGKDRINIRAKDNDLVTGDEYYLHYTASADL